MAQEGDEMVKTTPVQNKALVLQAFDTLFNKRDYKAAATARALPSIPWAAPPFPS